MFTPIPATKTYHFEEIFRVLRAVLVVGMLAYIVSNAAKFQSEQRAEWRRIEYFHKDAVAGRKAILDVQLTNQQALNDHIKAAIERWKQVPILNPGFKSPHVEEPTLPDFPDANSDSD